MFFHTLILVRTDRGILQHEFGVAAHEIEWFMERGPEKSHAGATGFKPPAGVRLNQIAAHTNIGEMMAAGELDATLLYLNSRNLVDRSTIDLDRLDCVKPLFRDRQGETRRYFSKTGIYPINHTVVMKRELYERHPWLALNLFHAFVAAKKDVEGEAAQSLQSYFDCGLIDPGAQAMLQEDPKAYGMKASRKVIETIARYVHEQGLSERLVGVDELFAASTMDV